MQSNPSDQQQPHPYDFPFEPYPIQVQLMKAIFDSAEKGKISILESPTGTGKSLSTICAALSWLDSNERHRHEEVNMGIRELLLTIKEAANDPDWLNVHDQKVEAEEKLEHLQKEQTKWQRVEEKLAKARQSQKKLREQHQQKTHTKRRHPSEIDKADEQENFLPEEGDKKNGEEEDTDLIPSDEESVTKQQEGPLWNGEEEEQQALNCPKVIYASRTHSQLEQFAKELERTRFRPRILTLGSRQMLCVNDAVRRLGQPGLINDRCNELLAGKGTKTTGTESWKRAKAENGKPAKAKKCGCPFARQTAIEDLSDAILTANEPRSPVHGVSELLEQGRQRNACPYFASKAALALSQLVLVPYNILLHRGTRKAWNLDLRGNVVLVDEAHNLLQTLASIHSIELSDAQLDSCCQCLHEYLDRFRTRLGPRNLRNVRQLHQLAVSLQRFLASFSGSNKSENAATAALVLSLPQFMTQLGDSMNIDLFRLLTYLEESKLCRKLRDFRLRYQQQTMVVNTNKTTVDRKQLQSLNSKQKESQKPKMTESGWLNVAKLQKEPAEKETSSKVVSATPLYQLREFIEALTSRAEDARIVVDRCPTASHGHRLRFILLNPAEKLRELITECRALILLGGTMRPVEQLMDAFKRVCAVPQHRLLEFSCGHVIGPEQLIAVPITNGPDKCPLNLQFANRDSTPVLRSLAQTVANLIRHIPNGVVAFFPSYAFLDTFVRSIRSSGHFAQLEKLKSLFVEARAGQEGEDVWPSYCGAARSPRGALLMAVVGGKLSEGINFSDELGRCVLMIGLPYPNRQSVELQERMRFVDQTVGPGAGNRLYEQLCLQSLNQAIGRAIRHRTDFAAILLLDQRFSRQNSMLDSGLPSWIRQRLLPAATFSEALTALIAFFRTHRQRALTDN